jgi:hypothetical protein
VVADCLLELLLEELLLTAGCLLELLLEELLFTAGCLLELLLEELLSTDDGCLLLLPEAGVCVLCDLDESLFGLSDCSLLLLFKSLRVLPV